MCEGTQNKANDILSRCREKFTYCAVLVHELLHLQHWIAVVLEPPRVVRALLLPPPPPPPPTCCQCSRAVLRGMLSIRVYCLFSGPLIGVEERGSKRRPPTQWTSFFFFFFAFCFPFFFHLLLPSAACAWFRLCLLMNVV